MSAPSRLTRREFGAVAAGAVASLAMGGSCEGEPQPGNDGFVGARPRVGIRTTGSGSRRLGLGARDAVFHLPSKHSDSPLPLLVLLHGAGGGGSGILRRLGSLVDEAGIAVLAPDSRDSSWDVLRGGLGPDVTFINEALQRVFESTSVDPARVAIGGFSDGASYALTLGLMNGELFRRIIAWSPGFIAPGAARGRPRVFVSHGTRDEILPIDRCSRVLVPQLQRLGYEVTFREFDGGHTVPPDLAREGLRWAAAQP
jgi:phospholipase/carboxylesterase